MMKFNLNGVKNLLRFEDLYATPNEYMKEANSLPSIKLDTEPLYQLHTDEKVLFTTKLVYYSQKVENEINRHLNAAFNLLKENGDDEDLVKFVVKETREAIITLVAETNRQLAYIDYSDDYWKQIISATPNYISFGDKMEITAFYHYVIVQLARCWLELQGRYAYIIGKNLYDVGLFYTSYVQKAPDPEFDLRKTEKYGKEAKKSKKIRTDCCFLYDNDEYFSIAIQEFTNKLKKYGLISEEVDYKKMETLFRGHSTKDVFQWLGDKHILTYVIKGLCTGDNPILTTWPEGTSKWAVVSARFCDKNGKAMPNIGHESERIKTEPIVKELIESFAGYK